jgi:hypothetical protein
MDWKFLLGLVGATGAWLWSVYTWHENQKAQRAQNEYQRKEQLYREMLKALAVFYKGPQQPPGAAGPFLEQYRLAWLYAPDEVVHAIDAFFATQKLPADQKDKLGQKALAELVSSVRGDLFVTAKLPTTLTASDFRHYSPG